jgi:hypothetical protein
MKKFILLISLLAMMLAGMAQTCSVSQTGANSIAGNSTWTSISQTFKACSSGRLNSIGLWHASGAQIGYSIRVEGPTGVSSTLGFAAANSTVSINFASNPYYLSEGEVYTIYLSRSAGSGSNFSFRYSTSASSYPDGSMNLGGNTAGDLYFSVAQQSFTAPTFAPADQATGVSRMPTLLLSFLEEMKAGSGDISIKKMTTAAVTTIPASEAVYATDGTVQVPVNTPLDANTAYSVYYATGTFKTSAQNLNAPTLTEGSWTFTTDARPALSLSANDTLVSTTFPLTITFTESVTGFDLNDITVVNATLSNFSGSGTTYTVDVTPNADGKVTLSVDGNVAEAAGALPNIASLTLEVDYESIAPILALSASIPQTSITAIHTIAISSTEKLKSLVSGDLTLTNAEVLKFNVINDTAYSVTIEASATGLVEVGLAADVVEDLAGNGNAASNTISFYYYPDVRKNMFLYAPFDGNLNDLSGANNGLTLGEGSPTDGADRMAKADRAALFGSWSTGRSTLNNPASTDKGFSVSCWVNPTETLTSTTTTKVIYEYYLRNLLLYENGRIVFRIADAAPSSQTTVSFVDTTLTAGTWYHIVASVEPGLLTRIFINNNEVFSGPAPVSVKTGSETFSTLNIGKGVFTGQFAYRIPASLDEFRLYNKALSPTEVSLLYNTESIAYQTKDVALCMGGTFEAEGIVFDEAGEYTYMADGGVEKDTLVTLNLTMNALPAVAANASRSTICEGDSIVLVGSGADSYVWDNGVIDGEAFYPTASGTYTVIGTDSSTNCSNEATIDITVNANSIVDESLVATSSQLCIAGDSTTVTTASSVSGIYYFLRDDETDEILDGPILGDGNPIAFNTGALSADLSLNVVGSESADFGVGQRALDFDGINDKVSIPYHSSMLLATAFTIEAWVYPRATSFTRIFSNFNGTGNSPGDVILDLVGASVQNGRGLRLYMTKSNGQASSISVDNAVSLNEWNHVAATFENGTMKLFVNGAEVKSGPLGQTLPATKTGAWVLGEDTGGTNPEFFNGKMDEVRVWNFAKSESDLVSAKDRCLVGDEAGLMAYYKFDDDLGSTTIQDYSSNSNNGTLINMNAATDWVSGYVNCVSGCSKVMSDIVEIMVGDSEKPTATAQGITVQLAATGQSTVLASQINNGSSDNCTAENELIFSLSKSLFTCDDLGENTIEFIVTDGSGNADTTTAVVTVNNFIEDVAISAPTQVCENESATITLASSLTGVNYFLKNAGGSVVDGPKAGTGQAIDFMSASIVASETFSVYGEISGIASNCGFTLTQTVIVDVIDDQTNPTVVAQAISVALDADGNATITAAEINDGSSDNCTAQEELVLSLDKTAFTCDDLGANTVTLTATDANGNEGTATATITVLDEIAPTAVAKNINLPLDANGDATLTAVMIDNRSSDNCGVVTLSIDNTSFGTSDLGENTVTLTVTDATQNQATAVATVTVVPYNQSPVINTPITNYSFLEDAAATTIVADLDATFSDPENDALTFSVASANPLLVAQIVKNAGVSSVVLTAAANFFGVVNVTVSATDQITTTDMIISVTVEPVNDQPVFTLSGDLTVTEDFDGIISIMATQLQPANESAQTLTYSISPASVTFANVSFEPNTGKIDVSAVANGFGTQFFTITANDGEFGNNTFSADFTLTVNAVDDAPVLISSIQDASGDEDQFQTLLTLSNFFTEVDGESLIYATNALNGDGVLNIQLSGDQLILTSVANKFGTVSMEVTASDPQNNVISSTFQIVVNAVNDAPAFTISDDIQVPKNFTETKFITVSAEAIPFGEENQVVTYSLSPASIAFANATINGSTGEVSFTAINDAVGSQEFTITANDNEGTNNTYTQRFLFEVLNNLPPVVVAGLGNADINEDSPTNNIVNDVANVFSDPENDALTYSISDDFGGNVTVNLVGVAIQVTPSPNYYGSGTITVTAADANQSVSSTFTLTVNSVNDAPVLDNFIPEQTAVEDEFYSFTIPANTFSDVDGDNLTISVSGQPAWLIFDAQTLTLSGTPANENVGSFVLNVSADDGEFSSNQGVNFIVVNVNDLPQIISQPTLTFDEDGAAQTIDLTTLFSDDDGDVLTFTLAAPKSEGSAIITATIVGNILTVTPVADANGTMTLGIMANDGSLESGINYDMPLSITSVNDAPAFSLSEDQISLEQDFAGTQTVNIVAGAVPFNETEQTVTYTITPNDGSLVNINLSGEFINITTVAGASGTATFTITASENSEVNGTFTQTLTITINKALALNDDLALSIFPNPATDFVMVQSKVTLNISIFNLNGSLMRTGESNQLIEVRDLESGVYLIQTKDENRKSTIEKLIIK